MILNPEDNKEHLADDYISDVLDAMPEKQKARFRDGLWVKAEGVIYEQFDERMILTAADMPTEYDRIAAGQDFGLNITNVKIGWVKDCIYVIADYGAFNMTTKSFNDELTARETEVIYFVCNGFRNAETGDKPAIGKRTMEGHKQALYALFRVRNESELLRVAYHLDLVEKDALCFYGGDWVVSPWPDKAMA
jgi:DNA-binding CsgD family transcriptional regulator